MPNFFSKKGFGRSISRLVNPNAAMAKQGMDKIAPAMQAGLVQQSKDMTAGLTPEQIQSTYEGAASRARSSLPTREAYQNALNSAAQVTGQQQAEQFNMRGQTPQSGVFADALTRNLAQQAAGSELNRAQLEAGQIGNFYNTEYGGALNANLTNANNANERYIANQAGNQQKENNTMGLIGAGIGLLGGPVGSAIGGMVGNQLGGGGVNSGGNQDPYAQLLNRRRKPSYGPGGQEYQTSGQGVGGYGN